MSIEVMRKLADAYKQVNESKFVIPEDIPVDERDMFMAKAAAAHKAGQSHFSMNGKKHPVTMKKDTAKAVNSSTNETKDDDVKENQKAALAKKISKVSQASAKGKAAVTLPPAPWDKKKEATKEGEEEIKMNPKMDKNKSKSAENDSMAETKGAPKGYHFTKDGKLKKGDAGQDGHGGKMMRSDPLDKQRSKIPPLPESTVYARILEARDMHTKGATPPEEIDSKDSPGAKKMRKDHEPEKKDNPEAGDDVIKAANAAKVAPKRPGDNAQADKMQKPAG